MIFSTCCCIILIKAIVPDFGVSTAILNTIYISRKWCKLNLGLLRGLVKSRHFPERIDARRQYIQIYRNNWQKAPWATFWIMIWIYYYLLNGIRLDLDLDNSCWIRKIPNFATSSINIFIFYTPHIV